MPDRPWPSASSYRQALWLAKEIRTAETNDRAMDRIVEAVGEVMVPDIIITVDRSEETLVVTRCEGAPDIDPTPAEQATGLAAAQTALHCYDARRHAANAKGGANPNHGTDDTAPVSSLARALWIGNHLFFVLVLLRRDDHFSPDELSDFEGLITLASGALDHREVHPPRASEIPSNRRDPKVEEEKRRVKTRKLTPADVAKFVSNARLIGSGSTHEKLLDDVQRYGDSDMSVLIYGESGTGKEHVARLFHEASPVAKGPYVTINMATIPPTLVESELFGHKKGAFTGATSDRVGCIELAEGGTLFLDEMGEFPYEVQAKLLRFLQGKKYTRLGDAEERTANVRVVCATNRDLGKEVKARRFRKDLYYRVAQVTITLAPLRKRMHDLPALVHHFLSRHPAWSPERSVDPGVWEVLNDHDWPGNVRELEFVINGAVLASGKNGSIERDHITITNKKAPRRTHAEVIRALGASQGSQKRAAKLLKITPRTVRRILRRAKDGSDSGQ